MLLLKFLRNARLYFYWVGLGSILAHGAIAQLSPEAPALFDGVAGSTQTNYNCPTCHFPSLPMGVPFPVEQLPVNENLLTRLSGYVHGDAIGAVPDFNSLYRNPPSRPRWEWEDPSYSFLKTFTK